MKVPFPIWFAILTMAILSTSCTTTESSAPNSTPNSTPKTARKSAPKPKPYPFNHCAVIKKPFDKREGAKHRRVHDGYEVLFCCTPCVKAFDTNPEAFMAPIRSHYGSLASSSE